MDELKSIANLFGKIKKNGKAESVEITVYTKKNKYSLDDINEINKIKENIQKITFSMSYWCAKMEFSNTDSFLFDGRTYISLTDKTNTHNMGVVHQIQEIVSKRERSWLFWAYTLFCQPMVSASITVGLPFLIIFLLLYTAIISTKMSLGDFYLLGLFIGIVDYIIYKIFFLVFPSVIIRPFAADEMPSLWKRGSTHIPDILKGIIISVVSMGIGYFLKK